MKAFLILQLFCMIFVCGVSASAQIPNLKQTVSITMDKHDKVEFANPLLNSDGSMLFMVTAFDDLNVGGSLAGQDIWVLSRDSTIDGWTLPVNLTALNNYENNSVVGVGEEDSLLYLLNTYSSKSRWKHALATSALTEDSTWSSPIEVKLKFPFMDDFRNLHVTSDGQMIIASGVIDKEGREDLHIYHLEGGEWTGPVNLTGINTSHSEISPFYYAPREALFFASNRPGGFGDYDIYVSYRQGDWNEWSSPVLLDESINSEYFDAYLSTYPSGESFFVSSKNKETSCIFQGMMDWVEPKIDEPDSSEAIEALPDSSLLEPIIVEEEPTTTSETEEEVMLYAVQVIAMPRGMEPKEGFFDNLDYSQVQMSPGKDKLDRYYLGVYQTKLEAIQAMKALRNRGYSDAFVRPILKYSVL